MPSNHVRRIVASVAPVGVLVAAAVVLRYAAGAIGTVPAALAAVLVFGGCGLAHSLRSRREPRLTRPAPVRLPEVTKPQEPARTAA